MGRPLKALRVAPDQIEAMASFGCSAEEIAVVAGCSDQTIRNRHAAEIERGRITGRVRLRKTMWEAALAGNVTMMIWLSKHELGWRDGVDVTARAEVQTNIVIDLGEEKGHDNA